MIIGSEFYKILVSYPKDQNPKKDLLNNMGEGGYWGGATNIHGKLDQIFMGN